MNNDTKTAVEMSGAKAFWTMLQEEGVDCVFGVCGITNVPLLHALEDMPGIKFIHAAHESVAMGMADGYYRATGKIGVVVVHNSGGLSNAMANLQNAYSSGSAVLVVAGQSDAPLSWNERLFDADCRPMVSQVTKAAWMLTEASDIGVAVNRALKEALTPSTRPVFLSLSTRAQSQMVGYEYWPSSGRQVAVDIAPSTASLTAAAALLAGAEKPVIFAGRNVADFDAVAELVSLAETLAAPVYTGSEEKLIFPSSHPLYRGTAFQDSNAMRRLVSSADVLLTVGSELFRYADLPDGPIVTADTKVIQIDLEIEALARQCPTELALLANPKLALAQLNTALKGKVPAAAHASRMDHWVGEHNQRKSFVGSCLEDNWQAIPIRWGAAFKEIEAALPDGAVIVDELASFYGQLSKVMSLNEPGSYFAHCDALGWGMPATLGVALGNPEKSVVGLLGDGGALFCIQALWTAANYDIPAVFVIFNNSGYGCMRNIFKGYAQAVGSDMNDADCQTYDIAALNYSELASQFGVEGRRVTDPTQIKPVLEEVIALKKPAVVELMICPNGSGLFEMAAEFFQ